MKTTAKSFQSMFILLLVAVLVGCVTEENKYLKDRNEISDAERRRATEEFNRIAAEYRGSCRNDSECQAVSVPGPCCGCAVAVLSRYSPAMIQGRLDDLCKAIIKRKHAEEECCCEATQARCDKGQCTIVGG
jgi:hypothetical protein